MSKKRSVLSSALTESMQRLYRDFDDGDSKSVEPSAEFDAKMHRLINSAFDESTDNAFIRMNEADTMNTAKTKRPFALSSISGAVIFSIAAAIVFVVVSLLFMKKTPWDDPDRFVGLIPTASLVQTQIDLITRIRLRTLIIPPVLVFPLTPPYQPLSRRATFHHCPKVPTILCRPRHCRLRGIPLRSFPRVHSSQRTLHIQQVHSIQRIHCIRLIPMLPYHRIFLRSLRQDRPRHCLHRFRPSFQGPRPVRFFRPSFQDPPIHHGCLRKRPLRQPQFNRLLR